MIKINLHISDGIFSVIFYILKYMYLFIYLPCKLSCKRVPWAIERMTWFYFRGTLSSLALHKFWDLSAFRPQSTRINFIPPSFEGSWSNMTELLWVPLYVTTSSFSGKVEKVSIYWRMHVAFLNLGETAQSL